MGKKLNVKFVEAYAQLDNTCGKKFGLSSGGVTEYIDRLDRARFAPERNETLQALNQYRELRNTLVHDALQMKRSSVAQGSDVRWIKDFTKKLNKQKDPISAYLKKAKYLVNRRKNRRRWRKFFGFLILFLVVAAVLAFGFAVLVDSPLNDILKDIGIFEYVENVRGLTDSFPLFEIEA